MGNCSAADGLPLIRILSNYDFDHKQENEAIILLFYKL